MENKAGYLWEAYFDEERNLYTASIGSLSTSLFEINKEIYDQLENEMGQDAQSIIGKGRELYRFTCDRCGPSYTIVFDDNYQKLCPWAQVPEPNREETWSDELTDAAVEVFSSQKNNREQRRKKKEEREKLGETEPKNYS